MKTNKRRYFIVALRRFIFRSQKYFFASIFNSNCHDDANLPSLPIALGVVYRRHRQAGQAKVAGLIAAPAPYGEDGGADPMALSGCAPKSVETRKSSTYLARRLATAEIKLAAAMMTRTRIIQRCIRVKFTLFHCISAKLFFSCCHSVAAPRELSTWAPRSSI
jgi:hypothetical protein